MKFTAVVALIAAVSAGAVEQKGHPLGEYVPRTPTIPTQAGDGGTNTWGCCTFHYGGPGVPTGACGKSATYSTSSARSTALHSPPERSATLLKIPIDSE